MTAQPPWVQATLDALDTNRQERQLCGVAAHEQLLRERDELRVVLDDLLQERNWAHRIGALQQAEQARPAAQEAINVLPAFDVLTAFSRSMEAFQTQRAGTEAEPEAEVGAGAEARPTTGSTHE